MRPLLKESKQYVQRSYKDEKNEGVEKSACLTLEMETREGAETYRGSQG